MDKKLKIMLLLLLSITSVALAQDESPTPPVCQGKTPPQITIDAVGLSEPFIRLRNSGGQSINLTGWRLTGQDTDHGLVFGSPTSCGNITTLDPSRTLTLNTKTPCALPESFIVSGGEVNLLNAAGASISLVKIPDRSGNGSTLYHQGNGYINLDSNTDILSLLGSIGKFTTFLTALKATGLDQSISLNLNSSYIPPSPPTVPEEIIVPLLPWYFGGPNKVDRSRIVPAPPPPPPPPPPPAGIPNLGPYTILAPSDDAFDVFRMQLGGGVKKLPLDQFLALPELKDIIQYHITPGRYETNDFYNGSMVYSGMGVPFVPFNDACMTEGYIMLSDSCVDKPTPDNYTCADQVRFDKCYLAFMTSSLAAQWEGGFCQFTCQRCSCSPPSFSPMDGDQMDGSVPCAAVVQPDRIASNGLIQVISRVLVPPPRFIKEAAIAVMVSPAPVDGTVAAASSSGI